MSETAAIIPANPSNPTPSLLLEDVFFAPLFQALQAPGITRGCATVDDASFAALAVLRVLENSKTGRDFIQIHGIPNIPGLTRSNYFDGLASPRRLQMFLAMERELQRQQLPTLRAHDDRLAHFGELDEMEIQPQTKQKCLHPHRLERQPRPHDRHAARGGPHQPRQRAHHQ